MEENEPMLKLVKEVAEDNWVALAILSSFKVSYRLFYRNNYLTGSISNLLSYIFLILLIASLGASFILDHKKYIYEESILNTTSNKVLITFMVCSTVGGLLPIIPVIVLGILHLLSDPSNTTIVLLYIGVALILLSIFLYYFLKMKIPHFFIFVLVAFLFKDFIPPHYSIWTLLTDTSLHIFNVLFYIGVALLLLSILSQIYYFSRMKIIYFLILLLGVFVLEYIILSYYPIWTANGEVATFILISALLITLDVIIYRKA